MSGFRVEIGRSFLDLKIPENFMHLVFLEGHWFVYLSLNIMDKMDHLSHPVVLS